MSPRSAFAARQRLLRAVEELFPVRFSAADAPVERGFAAQVIFSGHSAEPQAEGRAVPTLVFAGELVPGEKAILEVSHSSLVDLRLRGYRLASDCAPDLIGDVRPSASVLAATTAANRPVWVGEPSGSQIVAAHLPELADGETLRDRLIPGRWLAGAALVHFLRTICTGLLPVPPPLRAAIVVDDPNLHWYRYGKVDFREVVAHAEVLGYHLAVAVIPLDLRFSYPPVVRLFRENPERLSLALHGNNHTRRELADQLSADFPAMTLAQAIRRARAFEQRTGLSIPRVLAPPHEACGRQAMSALVRLGFEAATLSRAFSWVPLRSVASPYADPDDPQRLAGFYPAEVMPSGLPVIIRRDLRSFDEARLLAFLDQPMVFYGHEGDFADRMALIETVARTINGIGDVGWLDLGALSRSNFSTAVEGDTMRIRPFARAIHVRIPAGISSLVIESLVRSSRPTEVDAGRAEGTAITLDDQTTSTITVHSTEERTVEITLRAADAAYPESIPDPRLRTSVVLRRLATEVRDRLHALA